MISSNYQPTTRNLPRLPFASPATETVIGSPASLASSKTANTYATTPRRGTDGPPNLNPGQSRSRTVVPGHQGKPGLETIFRQQEEFPRSKLPALSLVTNLNTSSLGTTAGSRHHGRKESLQMRRKMSKNIKNKDAMKGPIGSLRRADSRLMELSPSDATLLIGIQIPSADFMPKTDGPRGLDSIVNSLAIKAQPSTPGILVTPADGEGGLKVPVQNPAASRSRRRAANNIDTQMTQRPIGVVEMPKMPPIPAWPSQSRNPSDIKAERRRSRVESWGTEIDDEPSPEFSSRPRTYSGDSQLYMLRRASGDTLATRHRSRGWWNQILSPFVDRSNTVTTKNSPNDGKGRFFWNTDMKMPFTMSPESVRQDKPRVNDRNIRESVRTSIWTDVSDWDAQRRTLDLSSTLHADRARGELCDNPSMRFIMSPEFEPVAGFGEASEYFEACWHDQNSPTPFFKCENHVCKSGPVTTASKSQTPGVEYIPPGNGDGESTFDQTPGNGSSVVFGVADRARERPMSDATEFEEDPEIAPEVQNVRAAPVVDKRAAGSITQFSDPETPGLKDNAVPQLGDKPMASEHLPSRPNIAVLPPEPFHFEQDGTDSPQAVTPGLQRALSTKQALPMSEISRGTAASHPQNADNINPFLDGTEPSVSEKPLTETTLFPPPRDPEPNLFPPPPTKPLSKADEKRSMNFRAAEETKPKETSTKDETPQKIRKRRRLYCFITLGLLAMIILILTLCLVLTRQHSDMPVQSAWLNITGYPPIPTGIATIAQPNAVVESPGCVEIETMWSCAVPKEQLASIAPNDADQPNFRVEIRYDNGTPTGNGTATSRRAKRNPKRASFAATASAIVRDKPLRRRDVFTTSLYTPDPAPPSDEEQVFIGNTTDGNVAPFDGEITPFYMSFLPITSVPSRLTKRQGSNTTDPFPNITSLIPPPDVNSDGTAAAANLLPFPTAQPLRLYNRGLPTEHYGFYNYFDRSIFLQYNVFNSSSSNSDPHTDDENGGSTEDTAAIRCTWTQTRFLVQIWTRQDVLLPSLANATSASSPNATTSSADDFSRPGSFPYPVSITIDRHGGDPTKKMLYCYGMDDNEHILSQEKQIEIENRAFGGTLLNPGGNPFTGVNVTLAEGGPGGADGGSGGCKCQWQNWQGNGS